MDIDVWMSTLQGIVLYHKRAPAHGKLSFDTPHSSHAQHRQEDEEEDDEDTFQLCIEHQQAPSAIHEHGTSRVIIVRLHHLGVHGNLLGSHGDKGKGGAASIGDTDRLLLSMEGMHSELSGMVGDISKLEQNERGLTSHVKETASRVGSLAALSLAVTVVTAGLQFKYYKTYFKHKKVC